VLERLEKETKPGDFLMHPFIHSLFIHSFTQSIELGICWAWCLVFGIYPNPNPNTQKLPYPYPKPNINTQKFSYSYPKKTQYPKKFWVFLCFLKNFAFFSHFKTFKISKIYRHMHPIKPKGLSLGLGIQLFGYLGFRLGFGYFANLLQMSNSII
jgi:hypothetical protein